MKPALVVLAAGASRRLGECKALVDLNGSSPLERLLRAGGPASHGPALVVTGAHHREIAEALARLRKAPASGNQPALPEVQLIHNPNWESGRTGAIRLAIEARLGRHLLLAPVDVPRVESATFDALVRVFEEAQAPDRAWLAPRFGARYGHPILIGRDLARAALDLAVDAPLRSIRPLADPLMAVDVHDPAILEDLDTPADLAHLRRDTHGRRRDSLG